MRSRVVARLVVDLPVFLSLAYLGLYVYVAVSRLGYPFDLEWMEGGMVEHVARILAGRPIYVRPSLEFTPFIYGPVYFYLSALTARITGLGLVPLRLVSFLASLGTFLVISRIVYRETQSLRSALVAAGLFAATFKICGAWFDVGRVDSLFLVLLLCAIYLLRNAVSLAGLAAAAALACAAFFTKQTTLIVLLVLLPYYLVCERRKFLIFVAGFSALSAAVIGACNHRSGGWFSYYLLSVPAQHSRGGIFVPFWNRDLLPIAVALGLALLAISRSYRVDRRRGWYYLSLLAALLVGGWFSRIHVGGYLNALMPTCAGVAILAGIGYARKEQWLFLLPAGLYSLQLLLLGYNPAAQIPDQTDRMAGQALEARLREVPGEIFMPSRPYLLTRIGKTSSAHSYAITDIFRANDAKIRDELAGQIETAVRLKRYAAIVVDNQTPLPPETYQVYVAAAPLFPSGDRTSFHPRVGYRNRPEMLLEPR